MDEPTEQEREWSLRMANLIVEMVQRHVGDRAEIVSQVGRELRASIVLLRTAKH
jgi:hypothetical protein